MTCRQLLFYDEIKPEDYKPEDQWGGQSSIFLTDLVSSSRL